MTDFLDLSVYLFNFLVMGLLPVVASLVLLIYIYLIATDGTRTLQGFLKKQFQKFHQTRRQ